MTPDSKQIFLSLVRQGIGNGTVIPDVVDWQAIKALADKQGLTAIIVDGIEQLPETNRPPQELLLQWIGEALHNYENYYGLYRRAIAELSGWYNAHGYKMMVLKGYACSINWPKPEHRPCGDIDIWLFGRQKEADAALASLNHNDNHNHNFNGHKGKVFNEIKIDRSHHHHTVFNWMGFTVENHYDFVNVHAHKSSRELEKVFKELGQDDSHSVEVMGDASICSATKVYLPSPNLHALFLIKHMVSHFAAAEISMRHVLDWAFFVEKHGKEVDWEWLDGMLVKYHMKDFFHLINAICEEDLGFEFNLCSTLVAGRASCGVRQNDNANHNYLVNTNDKNFTNMKERVLDDILDPKYAAAEPQGFINRMIYKYKRWQGNAWKQKLCYSESRWSSFWTGIWAKILKPASFLA